MGFEGINATRVYPESVKAEAFSLRKIGVRQIDIANQLDLPTSTVRGWFQRAGLTRRRIHRARVAAPEPVNDDTASASVLYLDYLLDEYFQTTPGTPEALKLSGLLRHATLSFDDEESEASA